MNSDELWIVEFQQTGYPDDDWRVSEYSYDKLQAIEKVKIRVKKYGNEYSYRIRRFIYAPEFPIQSQISIEEELDRR